MYLRKAIAENEYKGTCVTPEDVIISDGAKTDTGNIGDIFGINNKVAVCDPVYPVYVDTNAMAGRAGEYDKDLKRWTDLVYMPCTEENDFTPEIPEGKAPDMIYLCFPNNPTGGCITREALAKWVRYAIENDSIILYDAAYRAYIREDFPKTIFEIEGAEKCAVEFGSFSKNAGFTGTRCAYTVIPEGVCGKDEKGNKVSLRSLWSRRMATKFNGVPYIVQRAAEAVYTPEGAKETKDTVDFYLENAKIIREGLSKAGYKTWGGVNSPYIWMKIPGKMSSWEFFDYLMKSAGVIGTPGSGFGPCGEGYFRLTGFGTRENTEKAVERIIKNS